MIHKVTRSCLTCNKTFVTRDKRKQYCSRQCAGKATGFKKKEKPTCLCINCGKSYKPKRNDRTTFCSRKCSFEYKSKNSKELNCICCGTAVNGEGFYKRNACSEECYRVFYLTECLHCGKAFEKRQQSQKYCSYLCASAHACRQDYGQVIKCEKCGNENIVLKKTGGKPKTVCDQCKKQQVKMLRNEAKRRRRARKYQVQYEKVNPNTIFERDNWTCYLCGKATPKQLRGLGKPASPQLDHVVPLARGGSHTKNNLACACRECNIKKGALTVEEYVQGRAY